MSQPAAFLWAYAIDQQGSAKELPYSSLPYVCQPGEYVWVHLQSDAQDAEAIIQQLDLAEPVSDSLLAFETRPRAMALAKGVLVYLRGINKNPGADPDDMVSLRIFVIGQLIVTARRKDRRLMSVQEVREQLLGGDAPRSPRDLLIQLVASLADRIHDTVDDIDDVLVNFETSQQLNKNDRQELAILRRQAASIRRYLAPQRDALDALFRLPEFLTQEQAYDLREQADRVTRYVEDLDLARERSIVLQDEVRNRIAEQQGMRMYLLSMVSAIFLPLTFLTGVFGMNVAGLPGTESPEAFYILIFGMVTLAVVMLVAMLWKHWL